MRLALFDLDHTLLAGDSDVEWPRYLISKGLLDAEHAAKQNDHFYEQYKAGTVPYSSVIAAQTTTFSSEQTALTVLSERLQASVNLISALGGGWTLRELP